jgi:hypothetical protein
MTEIEWESETGSQDGALELLVEDWKKRHMNSFAPVMFHTCSKQCQLVELVLAKCPVAPNGICLGGGSFPTFEVAPQTRRRRIQYMHQPCFQKKHDPFPEPQAWACIFSGNIHWCGKRCSMGEENREGDLICLLTGRVQRDLVYGRQKNKAPAGVVYSDSRDNANYKTEYVRLGIEHHRLGDHHAFVANGIRKKNGTVLRREFFSNCIIFVNDYLSVRIVEANGPSRRERRAEVLRAMERTVQARKRTEKFSFLELVQVAAQIRQRHPVPFIIRMSRGHVRKQASLVATRIVVLIGLMRLKVPGARDYMHKLSLKEVFISGLELCRTGISLRGTTYLSVDPILTLISSGAEDIAHYWREHVDHKMIRGGIRKHAKKLAELFMEAVTDHGIHPEYLRVDELATSVENISTDAFEDW